MEIEVPRNTAVDPLGIDASVPPQIDIFYHDLELRVSEAFVIVDKIDENHSHFAEAGSFLQYCHLYILFRVSGHHHH